MTHHINDNFFRVKEHVPFNSPLLEELIELIMISGDRQDYSLSLSSALMTLNLFAGREVLTPTNSSMIMYMIILASTGYGKDRFLRAPSNIITSMHQPGIGVRMSISSVPAVEKAFRNYPIVYNQMDEIGNLFFRLTKARASNVEFSLDTFLKSKWGVRSTDIDVTTETRDRDSNIIKYPILNIFGASTAEQLYGSLNKRALCDGFYNRFLIVKADNMPKNRVYDDLTLTQSIIDGLANFNALSENSYKKHEEVIPQFKVPWANEEARQAFCNFDDEIEPIKHKSVDMHNLFVRLPEMALRIATLVAVSRDFKDAKVTVQDLEFAINFVKKSGNISARYTQTMMSDNASEAMRNRMLMFIEASGIEGVGGRDICRKLGINKRVRDAALQDLIDTELIYEQVKEHPTRKNKIILYFSNSEAVQNRFMSTRIIDEEFGEEFDE